MVITPVFWKEDVVVGFWESQTGEFLLASATPLTVHHPPMTIAAGSSTDPYSERILTHAEYFK